MRLRARIAQENRSRSGKFATLALLWSGLRFNPVLTIATCCLILVGLAGVLRDVVTRPASQRASKTAAQAGRQPNMNPAKQNSNTEQVADAWQKPGALADHPKRNVQSRSGPGLRRVNPGRAGVSPVAKNYAPNEGNPALHADTLGNDPILPSQTTVAADLDADSVRHIERAEMLLRSFKNSRLLRKANTLDLKYERQLSKDLVSRNSLLRRDAELAGNLPLARLLDRLEPFLLEIANLQDNSGRQEIRFVREGLVREQIIAALQTF